jgi:predicted metal-binding membrane protein
MLGLMTASMMAPFLIEPERHGVARSLRSRRTRAVGLVVGAHLLVWTVCGVVAQVSVGLLVARVGSAPALTAALLAALVWQACPMAQRLANRHHAHPPLAAFGRAADVGLVGYGVRHAAACWGACWPVMLLPAVDGAHALAAMALGSLWIWAFALEGPARPEWRVPWPARAVRLAQARLTSLRGVARETLRRWFPTLCR